MKLDLMRFATGSRRAAANMCSNSNAKCKGCEDGAVIRTTVNNGDNRQQKLSCYALAWSPRRARPATSYHEYRSQQ